MIIDWDNFLKPYDIAVKELTDIFLDIKNQDDLSPILYVEGRVKRVYSLLYKLERKNYSIDDIENKIDDIAGIRLVCNFMSSIDQVIQIIKNLDNISFKINEERDYIHDPKTSGYRSYHVLIRYPVKTKKGTKYIRAEIQIRSIIMDFWAKLEHTMLYKQGNLEMDRDVKRRFLNAAKTALQLDWELGSIYSQALPDLKKESKGSIIEEIQKNICYLGRKNNPLAELYNKDFLDIYLYATWEELVQFNSNLVREL